MVLLTLTAAARAAVDEYCKLNIEHEEYKQRVKRVSDIELGSPIQHNDLIEISESLVENCQTQSNDHNSAREWRLETLLKGALVYQPPPTPKPEPSDEYKALMKRLRQQEEERQYELMINPPPPKETFNQRFPYAASQPSFAVGNAANNSEEDEVTYADVNRQMALIINVLVSIIACSVAIWIAARRWEVHYRLGLSMSGSALVAMAEVAIYMGYIRRIKDARQKERGTVERKEIIDTWVFDGTSAKSSRQQDSEGVRFRKGKHR